MWKEFCVLLLSMFDEKQNPTKHIHQAELSATRRTSDRRHVAPWNRNEKKNDNKNLHTHRVENVKYHKFYHHSRWISLLRSLNTETRVIDTVDFNRFLCHSEIDRLFWLDLWCLILAFWWSNISPVLLYFSFGFRCCCCCCKPLYCWFYAISTATAQMRLVTST